LGEKPSNPTSPLFILWYNIFVMMFLLSQYYNFLLRSFLQSLFMYDLFAHHQSEIGLKPARTLL